MYDVFRDELCEILDDQILSVAWHVLFNVVLYALNVITMLSDLIHHVLKLVAILGNELLKLIF
jgi:hypothetical protein